MSFLRTAALASVAILAAAGTAMALDSRDDMIGACEAAAAAGDRFIFLDGIAYDCEGEVHEFSGDAPCDPLTEWCFGGGGGGGYPDPRGDGGGGRGGGRGGTTAPTPPKDPCDTCDTDYDACFANAASSFDVCLDTFQRQAQLMCSKYHRDVRGQFVSGGYACRFENVEGGGKLKICEGPGMTACMESYRGGLPGEASSATHEGTFNVEILGGTEQRSTTVTWSSTDGYFNACQQLMGIWNTSCGSAKARCKQQHQCRAPAPIIYQAGGY